MTHDTAYRRQCTSPNKLLCRLVLPTKDTAPSICRRVVGDDLTGFARACLIIQPADGLFDSSATHGRENLAATGGRIKISATGLLRVVLFFVVHFVSVVF